MKATMDYYGRGSVLAVTRTVTHNLVASANCLSTLNRLSDHSHRSLYTSEQNIIMVIELHQ